MSERKDRSFLVLGVPPDITVGGLKRHWRSLATKHHPDHGGDPAEFDKYRKAYNEALDIAIKRERDNAFCRPCNGTGRIIVRSGFNQTTLTCSSCRGKGVN